MKKKQIWAIEDRVGWMKVRKLANGWYRKVHYLIPTKAYIFLAILGGSGIFATQGENLWLIFLTAFSASKIYAREERVEGYVDGWNQGQEYLQGEYTIDELLKEPKE